MVLSGSSEQAGKQKKILLELLGCERFSVKYGSASGLSIYPLP